MFKPRTLIAERLNLGLTRAQLAERLGVTERAVAHWETGKRSPRPPQLFAIARETEKPVEHFLDLETAA